MTNKFLIIAITGILFSCARPVELEGVDLEKWNSDSFGCNGKRQTELGKILDQKALLEGISSDDFAATLGKPDQVELYKRSQKFMLYYIDAGPGCPGNDLPPEPKILKVRVDALGTVKELFVVP